MPKCNAIRKSDGLPCQAPAMPNGKCRMHGGATPSGIASANYKNGRYSKHLPTRLLERFETSLSDPELLNLSADIALLDSRLEDLLKRVDSGESGKLWQQAKTALEDFRAAQASKDGTRILASLHELQQIITRGNSDYAAWNEVSDLLERRRRLVESERKRQIEMDTMVRAEQFALFIRAYFSVLEEEIDDRKQLARITTRIASFAAPRVAASSE